MSTNTKLAEALRRLIGASMVAMTDQELATGETLSAWEDANEALAAHDAEQAAQAVPAGFKWVPVEPTPEMRGALRANGVVFAETVWREVLAATPQAAQPEPEQAQQSERERFEDVARSLGFQRDELNRSNLSLVRKDYRNHATEECWKFWQAARADILARLGAVPVAWPSAADIADEIDALLPMSHGDSTRAAIEEWWRHLVKRKLSKIAPPAAEPLTDEQIESIRAQVFAKALQRCDGCDHETWDHWFARAIEAAHGIAATTGEQR